MVVERRMKHLLSCLFLCCLQQQGGNTADISQWVSSVTSYSTQYSAGSNSAAQVIGTPDIYPGYNGAGAWAPATMNTNNEFIEFTVNTAVCVTSVSTYEVYTPGFVVKILAKMPNGAWDELWSGTATLITSSRIFTPTLKIVTYTTNMFRINMDASASTGYIELDAVRVDGIPVVCVPALWTSATLSPSQNLCSPNNLHKVALDSNGGILIDGQQWLSSDPSSLSPTLNYTAKHQLIIVVNGNPIKWQLDLPSNSDNGLPGNVTVTNDGLLQIVNANGVPLWNHKHGYLLSRLVSTQGPSFRSVPLIEDRNNATCTSSIELVTMRITPILRNSSILATVVGKNLTCTSPMQLKVIIPGTIEFPSAAGRGCTLVSNIGTSVCVFSCTCPTVLCETVTIVNFGCVNTAICEVTLP